MTGVFNPRFERQVIMPEIGADGQKKLLDGKVLVVGAGGLGSPAAFYLAAAGVGTIGIADCDSVEVSNLNRQILHGEKDIGKRKTVSAKESLKELNPEVCVETFDVKIDRENVMDIISGYDVIVDAVDNFFTRFLIGDACFLEKKPLVEGGVTRWGGQVTVISPEGGPCFRCIVGASISEAGSLDTRHMGIIGAAAGVIGAIEALEAVKILIGAGDILIGRLLVYDGLKARFREISLARNKNCPLCGEKRSVVFPGQDTVE